MKNIDIINKIEKTQTASKEELVCLLNTINDDEVEALRKKAQKIALNSFGNCVFIRGLIEISSICKNDCYYCGLRKSNNKAKVTQGRLNKLTKICQKSREIYSFFDIIFLYE